MSAQTPSSYGTGLVVVHGIGKQRPGRVAGEATECLLRFVPDDLRVEANLVSETCRVPLTTTQPTAPAVAHGFTPAIHINHACVDSLDHELSVTSKRSKSGRPRSILVTEAYWDNLVQSPPSYRLTLWSTVMMATIMWHYASTALFLEFDEWRTERRNGSVWRRTLSPWLSMIYNAFFFTVATPLLAVATFVGGLLLTLVQFVAPRSRLARAAHAVLSDTVGDAWAYTSTDQAQVLIDAVTARINEVREQCQRVIVVGHSQGAELARQAIIHCAPVAGFASIGSGQLVLGAIQLARKSVAVLLLAWLSIVTFPVMLFVSGFWLREWISSAPWARLVQGAPTDLNTEFEIAREFPVHYASALVGFALFCVLIFVFHRRPAQGEITPGVRRIDVYNTLDPVSFGVGQFPDARAIRPRLTLRTLRQGWRLAVRAHTQYWVHRTTAVAMWDLIEDVSSPVPTRRTPAEARIAWTLKALAVLVCAVLSYALGAGIFSLLPDLVRAFLLSS